MWNNQKQQNGCFPFCQTYKRVKIYCEIYMLFLEYTHIYEDLPIKAYDIFKFQ